VVPAVLSSGKIAANLIAAEISQQKFQVSLQSGSGVHESIGVGRS
jgi:hypothetical protein